MNFYVRKKYKKYIPNLVWSGVGGHKINPKPEDGICIFEPVVFLQVQITADTSLLFGAHKVGICSG